MTKRLLQIFLVSLSILGSVCFAEECTVKEPSCDARATRAYQYMYDLFGPPDSAIGVYVNDEYGPGGKLNLERREHKFEQLEKWASTLPEVDRRAYLGVIQYYETGAKEAYLEWHTHKTWRDQTAFMRRLQECAEAAAKVDMPKPPTKLLK